MPSKSNDSNDSFTLDKNLAGPDHKASLEPKDLSKMISCIRNIELAISGDGIKKISSSEKKNVDIVMPWFAFQDNPLEETIVKYLADFSKKKKKPLLVGGNGGPYTKKMSKLIEKHNIPVYDDLRTWVVAASALAQFRQNV